MANTVALLMRKAPYGSVYALVKGQDPAALDMKPLGDGFPMLPDFGVSRFYVHDQSLNERGLKPDDLVMDVEIVDGAGVARLLQSSGVVLPF
jgi:sulfur relay (sulfurtransferase) DsrF/TusC family protein